jgi:hypothetical protein
MWLMRKTGLKVKAHVWNGKDTACRMASTGGLKMSRFEVCETPGTHEVCHMCAEVEAKKTNDSQR